MVLLIVLLLAQTPAIDRAGVEKAIDGKKVEFDFEHLNSMPFQNQAWGARTDSDIGHLKLYRDIQKDPLSFPDRILAISDACVAAQAPDDLIPVLAAALDRPAGEPAPSEACTLDLSGLPEALRTPIGLLSAACDAAEKERQAAFAKGKPQGPSAGNLSRTSTDEMMQHLWSAARILLRAVKLARPALEAFHGEVDFSVEGKLVVTSGTARVTDVPLVVDLGGDDAYEGPIACAKDSVRLVVEVGGNDAYKGPGQGAAEFGVGILCDFGGNDSYEVKETGQGSGQAGVGMLLDDAGDDKYVAHSMSQGSALVGIGVLVDREGNDSYRGVDSCMGFGYCSGFGMLLDLAGDDTYHMNDPDFGDPLENAAPQDDKHAANSGMGGGWGDNGDKQARRAGGVGMLVDAKGDDVYQSGCWAQGVGYFLGVGALVDYEGDDRHRSWVYTTGSGAHGGFGCCIDRKGDDVWDIGGWNCLGMSVDYGMGMFLDDAGNDRYLKTQSGLGWTVGLGIAVFQDRGGDDDYEIADGNAGYGQFYEKEDYNSDGKVTPGEKRHFGIFLDLGGMDHYANGKKNGTAWKQSDFAGGYDASDPKPGWNVPDGWEDLSPIEVMKLGKGAAAEAKAAFADLHQLLRFLPADALTSRYGADGAQLAQFLSKAAAVKAADAEALAATVPAKPAWLAREAKAAIGDALGARREALLGRLEELEKALGPLVAARKAVDAARAEAQATPTPEKQKALAKLWGANQQAGPARGKEAKVDAALREAPAELDALEAKWVKADAPWRTKRALAAANLELASVTLQTLALTPEERAGMKRSEAAEAANKKAKVPPVLAQVNDYRKAMGRPVLAFDEALGKAASAEAATLAKTGKPEDKPKVDGFGETALLTSKGKSPGEILKEWLGDPARHALLLDAKWTHAGAGGAGAYGGIVLGVKK